MTGRRGHALVPALVFALTLTGCASKPVERVDPELQLDVSGSWNETDSQRIARHMVDAALGQGWLDRFERESGQQPVVIVGTVRNRSHEYINVHTFVNAIRNALIQSGRVTFVASDQAREEVRAERRDQDLHASADTRKRPGQERGADFMLQGEINTIFSRGEARTVRYYQVDLTMVSLADNRQVWAGQQKIKKIVDD
jgi:hypothetical protein